MTGWGLAEASGIANYVVPLMIGAPDMAFPRLNALSFWLLPTAGVMMMASFFVDGGAFATGWTAYAPLSTEAPLGQQFFTIGVQFAGASSIATALNFLGFGSSREVDSEKGTRQF